MIDWRGLTETALIAGSTDERRVPAGYAGALPAAYDRRTTPRTTVIDRREYDRRFAESLRAIRDKLKEHNA